MLAFASEPVNLAFLLSLLLSLIAVTGSAVIGRDAAFYLDIAQQVNTDGIAIAFKRFNWPWYSVFIAYLHKITSFSYEAIAYIYSFLLMAGTASLIVSMVKKIRPEASYWAVLLVLSIPAFNIFRDDLLRDIGFWFFLTLSLWLMLLENSKIDGFLRGALVQLSVVMAMFFRLEAAFILPALALYIVFFERDISIKQRALNVLKISTLFIVGLVAAVASSISQDWLNQARVVHYLSMIQPESFYKAFMVKSDKFAHIALAKWSYSDAPLIILSGIFFALCVNAFKYGGLVSLLLIPSNSRKAWLKALGDFKLHAVAAVLYFVVLYVFFVQKGFINSRYSTLLILLLVPFFAVAAKEFFATRKKLAAVFVILSVVMALSNVVSTGESKAYYLDAAKWIENNTSAQDKILYDNSRVAYYAGRGYPHAANVLYSLEEWNILRLKNYQYFVVTLHRKETKRLEKIKQRGFEQLFSAEGEKKIIYILTHTK